MNKLCITILVIVCLMSFFNCARNRSKCPGKDITCKSKELIEVLLSEHYSDADKYFLLDRDGTILGAKRDFYSVQFKGLHEDLVRNGLPDDSCYRLVPNSMQGIDVIVTLIDSSKHDINWMLETLTIYFANEKQYDKAEMIGYQVGGKASKERTEKGKKELYEWQQRHPYPKGFDNTKIKR